MTDLDEVFRLAPELEESTEYFWTGGADGELRILRCQSCRFWIHPPTVACPNCLSRELAPEATSGKGRLLSFAVEHRPNDPRVPVPYVVGLVELPEQEGLRLLSNLVHCDPADAAVDMPVRVVFVQKEDAYIPLWEPDRS